MTKGTKLTFVVALAAVAVAILTVTMLLRHGFSARDEPSALEAMIARRLRWLAIPADARQLPNPLPVTPEILADARAHFADHCAICHANDGGGNTEIGQNLYPRAPDMREKGTQSLSDGELFYIIHNGIRFTGMPAWGSGTAKEDVGSWKLVHFIRHLPEITSEEIATMEELNPKSQHKLQEKQGIRRFLLGETELPTSKHSSH